MPKLNDAQREKLLTWLLTTRDWPEVQTRVTTEFGLHFSLEELHQFHFSEMVRFQNTRLQLAEGIVDQVNRLSWPDQFDSVCLKLIKLRMLELAAQPGLSGGDLSCVTSFWFKFMNHELLCDKLNLKRRKSGAAALTSGTGLSPEVVAAIEKQLNLR